MEHGVERGTAGGGEFVRAVGAWARRRSFTLDGLDKIALVLLLAAFFKSLAWAILNQQVPDEHGYLYEILWLIEHGEPKTLTGHIVGVFAYTGAAAVRIGGVLGIGPLLSVRLLGVACVTVVSWLAYRTGKALSDHPFVPLASLVLVTFNPMNSFMGSSANSDTMQTMWASALILSVVLMLIERVTPLRLVGAVAFAVLAYFTKGPRGLLIAAVLVLALLPIALLGLRRVVSLLWRVREVLLSRAGVLAALTATVAVVLAKPLYWGLWNAEIPATFMSAPGPQTLHAGNTFPSMRSFFDVLFRSGGELMLKHLWGYFGLLHVPGSPLFYSVHHVLLWLAAAGVLFALGRGCASAVLGTARVHIADVDTRTQRASLGRAAGFSVLALAVFVITYASVEYSLHHGIMVQGRYLLTFVVPIYVLVAYGISLLVPRRWSSVALLLVLVLMSVVNVWALVYITVPYFY